MNKTMLSIIALLLAACSKTEKFTTLPPGELGQVLANKEGSKPEYVWPDCSSPKEDYELHGIVSIGHSNGFNTWYKKEVSPGKWQWVIDEEIREYAAKRENRKRELFYALQTRLLTLTEMNEVSLYGEEINIQPMTPYRSEDKQRERNAAFLQQFQIRLAAEKAAKESP